MYWSEVLASCCWLITHVKLYTEWKRLSVHAPPASDIFPNSSCDVMWYHTVTSYCDVILCHMSSHLVLLPQLSLCDVIMWRHMTSWHHTVMSRVVTSWTMSLRWVHNVGLTNPHRHTHTDTHTHTHTHTQRAPILWPRPLMWEVKMYCPPDPSWNVIMHHISTTFVNVSLTTVS